MVDARLSRETAPSSRGPEKKKKSRSKFLEMGFDVADAEKALAFCANDVDAALSMLLQAKADAHSA